MSVQWRDIRHVVAASFPDTFNNLLDHTPLVSVVVVPTAYHPNRDYYLIYNVIDDVPKRHLKGNYHGRDLSANSQIGARHLRSPESQSS